VFYIVEEESKLVNLENLVRLGCYVDVIPTHDLYHPQLTTPIAVYIRLLKSDHGFIIPIDHDEGLNVDKHRIYQVLSKASKLYTLDKKKLLYYFNLQEAIDVSLLYSMVTYNKLDINHSNSAINYFYNKFRSIPYVNKLIPISKLYESYEKVYSEIKHVIELDIPDGFDFYNKTATNVFYLLEQHGIGIYYEPFVETFSPRDPLYNIKDNKVLTSYNLYNATSRPTNSYNSINFAAIPHTERHRKTFRPQNDYFVEFDFDGYHLRLLSEQINYKLTSASAHKQLAELYFGKEEITDEEYTKAKQINFQAIYGKIPEKHKDLKIFKEIQEYIDDMWKRFNDNGYVCNPQSGKHFTKELKDMHPAKLMNYMMQSLETSNNILILKEVLRYLKDKKTKIALFTYDAILFDFSKEDGKKTLEEIQKILEKDGKYPVKFKFSKNLVL
jgi:hypothetical protein